MKKVIAILGIFGFLTGCSWSKDQLTNQEKVELFLEYVKETQQQAIVAEYLKTTPITAPIYHILLLELKDSQNQRKRLWRQIEKIKELKEEAKEFKAKEQRVANGESYEDVLYEPINLRLKKEKK